MDVLKALGATVLKMFAADLWLTLSALAAVGGSGAAVRLHWIAPEALPFLLAAGVLAALVLGVAHGARR
ncbi:MAG TPA: hypothetical protein VGS12_08060 [Caulobacteraceae bacterium]|nr:hypothetical protein [Caulobacteraceae bacterium]